MAQRKSALHTEYLPICGLPPALKPVGRRVSTLSSLQLDLTHSLLRPQRSRSMKSEFLRPGAEIVISADRCIGQRRDEAVL